MFRPRLELGIVSKVLIIEQEMSKSIVPGPRVYVDALLLDIFGKSFPTKNFKRWY